MLKEVASGVSTSTEQHTTLMEHMEQQNKIMEEMKVCFTAGIISGHFHLLLFFFYSSSFSTTFYLPSSSFFSSSSSFFLFFSSFCSKPSSK